MPTTSLVLLFGLLPFFVESEIKNLRFFGLWLGASPQANILEFRSTLIIPSGLPDTVLNDGVQAFWPGMEPPQMNSVFQNVITNGDTLGQWSQLPFYCCNPGVGLASKARVYPGDRVTNIFVFNENTFKWWNTYTVTPGAAGHAAGQNIFANDFEFNPSTVIADNTTLGEQYTAVLMTIELQGNANWTWGPVDWRDILLRINTTETSWCTAGPLLNGGQDFTYNFSQPTVGTVDNTTTCYIAQMSFLSPKIPSQSRTRGTSHAHLQKHRASTYSRGCLNYKSLERTI